MERKKAMTASGRREVTILLSDEQLRKIAEDHLLEENELDDRIKLARVVQKLLDASLGLPDRPWHEWDEWVKGLE